MFTLPQYNDIFGYFTAISLYRESRYNDLIPLLPWHIVISGFHCLLNDLFYFNKEAKLSDYADDNQLYFADNLSLV